MKFTKMHGCGNDYIYIDGAAEKICDEDKPELVRRLSDRHFGIGGDGIIFVNPSEEADFEMEMYNADGSRAEMCGNGIRCVAKFVYDKGLTDKHELSIVSCGSIKYIELCVECADSQRGQVKSVRVNMGSPILKPSLIPVDVAGDKAVSESIEVDGTEYKMTCVSMGNPHAIIYMDGVRGLDIEKIGPKFENHRLFPKRVNTEFVEVIDKKHVFMRVWERGSGETLACGTGCCAICVAGVLNGVTDEKITVGVLGGELEIEWDKERNVVFMTGPATTVFEGTV